MRRRRRQRVVWLPTWGSVANQDQPRNAGTSGALALVAGTNNSVEGVQLPITYDLPTQSELAAGTAPSLADFTLNSYKLKRFVGKLHLCCSESFRTDGNDDFDHQGVFVTASLIVRRVDSAGQALANANFDDVDNANVDNITDPFIWRRSWVLAAQPSTFGANAVDGLTYEENTLSAWPKTNAEYGSALDGPHIDTKGARIVGPEERLFFEITARPFNFGTPVVGITYTFTVLYVFDYRLLAVPMRSTNRRNASR